jgi:hypothetical protein
MAQQRVTGVGEAQRARAALDQREPDLGLQRGDLLRHR